MWLLAFYASISILCSFLCSVLEAVLLSITPTFVNIKLQEGKSYAKSLENIKKDIDKPLIAILTLNTIAHTVGAILVGVQAKKTYLAAYGSNDGTLWGMSFSEDAMVGIVSTIMTILILVVSEIIPKTLGASYWKQLANFTTKALVPLIFVLKYTGFLWFMQLTTKLIGSKHEHGSVLSREDFHAMTNIAQEKGVFEAGESAIIRNLLTFKNVEVKDVMTPRTVMVTAESNNTIQSFFQENPKLRFSRIPIYDQKTDAITGFILKDEIMEAIINGKGEEKLSTLKRELLVTNRSLPIPELFEKFITEKAQIALVVDEYGTPSGLVTMEDVIETLLGLEIMDESDNVADLQLLARKSWEARAKRIGLIKEKDKEEKENNDEEV